MQVTETLSDGLKRGFTVVVPAAELDSKRAVRLAELGKTMQLPGFRPGKVPMSMVKKRYGDAVSAEIVEREVSDASDRLLAERGLRPAMTPKLEVTKPGQNSDLEFTMEMEVLPEITVPGLADIELKKQVATVADTAVDAALAQLLEQRQSFEPVTEPRPAVAGDQLTVDYTGRIDGEAFVGGAATDANIIVAGSGFIPGFSEQMEGMTPGETKTILVDFPADYGAKELAGKTASFEINAKTLSVPVKAVADDAFAKTVGLESMEDLRGKLSEQIGRDYERMSRIKLKRALLDILAERAQFAAPVSLVDAEFNEIWRQVSQEKAAGNEDPEDEAKDEVTLQAEYRAIADRRVRLGLLVAEIGRANQVTVTDQEMQQAMFAEAMKYRNEAMQVLEFFKKNPQQMERFRGPIFEDKVVDYLFAQAKVEETTVTPEELMTEPEA